MSFRGVYPSYQALCGSIPSLFAIWRLLFGPIPIINFFPKMWHENPLKLVDWRRIGNRLPNSAPLQSYGHWVLLSILLLLADSSFPAVPLEAVAIFFCY